MFNVKILLIGNILKKKERFAISYKRKYLRDKRQKNTVDFVQKKQEIKEKTFSN